MSKELLDFKRKKLDTVGCGFCPAKWYNATIDLGSGYTRSCYLPLPHKIDIKEILKNPSAIHNTSHKKQMRKMMLSNIRPAECSYCWKVEDIGRDNISDRVYRSIEYKEEDIEILKNTPWDADVNLRTVELSFDRSCNFACSYCNPAYSTTWGKDIEINGAYQHFKTSTAGAYQSNGKWADPISKDTEDNPYVTAFFEWWPELSKDLQTLRITGGEPSTSPNFWKFLDKIQDTPYPKLNLSINSNLGVKDDLIEKLITTTHSLKVDSYDIYTSCEAYGEHAEYLRDGLVYPNWKANVVKIIEKANIRQLVIMMTVTGLSLMSITEFMDDMIELKKKYGKNKPILDLNFLRWPAFMSPLNLPDNIKLDVRNNLIKWLSKTKILNILSEREIDQIQRVIDYIDVVDQGHARAESDKDKHFHDFKSFYEQYDIRRNKNFRKTFPMLVDWYDSLKVDYKIPFVTVPKAKGEGMKGWETGEYPILPPTPAKKLI
jgi:organic radical activating enzyme